MFEEHDRSFLNPLGRAAARRRKIGADCGPDAIVLSLGSIRQQISDYVMNDLSSHQCGSHAAKDLAALKWVLTSLEDIDATIEGIARARNQ